ncbi:hypothetical protein [Halobellus rufus]|nr:hypothetical protein [Halobellus rufus]
MSSETTIANASELDTDQADSDDEITLDPQRELNFVLQKRNGEV